MYDYELLGFIVIVAGIVLILIASISSSRDHPREDGEVKGAAVVMIGPIPIVFGNDSRMLVVLMVLAIVLVVLGIVAGLR